MHGVDLCRTLSIREGRIGGGSSNSLRVPPQSRCIRSSSLNRDESALCREYGRESERDRCERTQTLFLNPIILDTAE